MTDILSQLISRNEQNRQHFREWWSARTEEELMGLHESIARTISSTDMHTKMIGLLAELSFAWMAEQEQREQEGGVT